MNNEANMENIANMETRPLNAEENMANMVTRPLNAAERIKADIPAEKTEHPDTLRFRELKEKKLATGDLQDVAEKLEYQVLVDRMSGPFVAEDEKKELLRRQSVAGMGNEPPLSDIEIQKIRKVQRESEFQKYKETHH